MQAGKSKKAPALHPSGRGREGKIWRNSIAPTSSGGWGCFPVGERGTKQRRKMRREEQEKNEEMARRVDEQKQKQQMSQSRC